MRYPDLICIGAQKSATTWLYKVLRKRKDLFLPRVKELHYFSQIYCEDARKYGPKQRKDRAEKFLDFIATKEAEGKNMSEARKTLKHIARHDVDDAWYAGIWETARPDQKCVDVCPSYMNLPEEGIRHVLRLSPDAPLVLLVRDPVDRAWSHMRMNISRGMPEDRKAKILAGQSHLGLFATYTDYADCIPKWEAQAKPGQLQLILHERVSTEPQTVVNELLAKLGLPPSPPDDTVGDFIFQGEKMELPAVLRRKLMESFKPQYDFLRERFPETVNLWQKKHEKALLSTKAA